MAQGKNPAFMYYPKDWRADSVFSCTLAARGLWHEMMNMMHASERYGYLSKNGCPIPDEAIARYCGCSLQEYQTLLAELSASNVPRRTTTGVIYSKRMVEDDKKRREWRKRQSKHRDTSRDITPMSRECHSDLQFPSPNLKPKTPLPPAGAGEESYFEWCRQTIGVHMGRKKRLPSMETLSGAQPEIVVQFLNARGFQARIVEVQ
jgi:hypothetical protein